MQAPRTPKNTKEPHKKVMPALLGYRWSGAGEWKKCVLNGALVKYPENLYSKATEAPKPEKAKTSRQR